MTAQRCRLEQIGGEMHNRRRRNRHVYRKKQGERRHQQRPQPEAGKERQNRKRQSSGADQDVAQSLSSLISPEGGFIYNLMICRSMRSSPSPLISAKTPPTSPP